MTQPINTNPVNITHDTIEAADNQTAALLVVTAQQAVMPRHLGEGIYATLDADGAIQITETPGYKQLRKHAWDAEHASRPETIRRNVTLLDVPSFIDYLTRNTYQAADTAVGTDYLHTDGSLELWADIDQQKITAILDGIDGWRRHTATLQLKKSREWTEWAAIDGKLLHQVEFAQFIEDHLSTIAEPDGATLLDICQTLQAHTSVAFKQQNILANGQRQFKWEETTEAKAGQKGDLKIPGELTLALRVFQGSVPIGMHARFRYQLREGVLRIGVKLAEPDTVLEDSFDEVIAAVQDQMPVHINHGRA